MDNSQSVMSFQRIGLVDAYAAAVTALAAGDPSEALAAVDHAEAALACIDHPDMVDTFNIRVLRIRGLHSPINPHRRYLCNGGGERLLIRRSS